MLYGFAIKWIVQSNQAGSGSLFASRAISSSILAQELHKPYDVWVWSCWELLGAVRIATMSQQCCHNNAKCAQCIFQGHFPWLYVNEWFGHGELCQGNKFVGKLDCSMNTMALCVIPLVPRLRANSSASGSELHNEPNRFWSALKQESSP